MRKHYTIALPLVDGLPILLVDHYQGGKNKTVTLKEAKDAVFKAVLQDHTFFVENNPSPLIGATITIIDKDEFERSRENWINENAAANLKEAMDRDTQS